MYENGTMRPVETVLRKRGRGKRRKMEGGNFAKRYSKHFCKYHNVPLVQLLYVDKF
jgi:hypothetical protein